jgi:hypothetical protein
MGDPLRTRHEQCPFTHAVRLVAPRSAGALRDRASLTVTGLPRLIDREEDRTLRVVLVEMLRERQQVPARTSLRTGRRLASISYDK